MADIAIYVALAMQVGCAIVVVVKTLKDMKRKRDFYDKAFEVYQSEYLRRNSKQVHNELKKFWHCQKLVINDLKK